MTTKFEKQARRAQGGLNMWRIIGWGGAVALILAPLIAMQFSSEVDWDGTDFLFAAIIFGIVGGLIELAIRKSSNWYYRVGAAFAVMAGFMLVWANAAVGMIGDGDNPANLWFGAVLLNAICGALLSRWRSTIMAPAMFVSGGIQLAIGLFAGVLGTDTHGGVITMILACLWFVSGGLFQAAKQGTS